MENILGSSAVFRIAEDIEKNGAHFYAAQAKKTKNIDVSSVFNMLKRAEVTHRQTFHKMHSDIEEKRGGNISFSTDQDLYLKSLADENVFIFQDYMNRPGLDLDEALKIGIRMEQASIDFYQIIKPLVERSQRKNVNAIIKQEYQHKDALLTIGEKFLT